MCVCARKRERERERERETVKFIQYKHNCYKYSYHFHSCVGKDLSHSRSCRVFRAIYSLSRAPSLPPSCLFFFSFGPRCLLFMNELLRFCLVPTSRNLAESTNRVSITSTLGRRLLRFFSGASARQRNAHTRHTKEEFTRSF